MEDKKGIRVTDLSESMPRCSQCEYCDYAPNNSGCNRYYCKHPQAILGVGTRVVCKCKRHTNENIKTSPKWCPRRV